MKTYWKINVPPQFGYQDKRSINYNGMTHRIEIGELLIIFQTLFFCFFIYCLEFAFSKH